MKILIVEDNHDKRKNIMQYFQKKLKKVTFGEAKSYSSGISQIYDEQWDLIILDMSLPTYDITHAETGGEMKPVAGKEILRRMQNRKIYTPVIIVTQFDVFGDKQISLLTLNEEFIEKFSNIWCGTVFYDKPNWQLELSKIFEELNIQETK